MRKFRVLDAFCCQGGSARGWDLAGFDVTGIDISPQPRYPYRFILGDAVEYIREHGHEYDLVTGSPPCQFYSDTQRIMRNDHPDLIGPTRGAMIRAGRPYVIENVGGAETDLRSPLLLCGAMFNLETYRHRLFETGGGFSFTPPPHPEHKARQVKMGRRRKPGEYLQMVGNFSGVDDARKIMGMPWANRDGLREAIPPAYTEFIGRQFLAQQD